MSNLLPCPKCGCPDELTLDSSSAAEASWIECGWCEHRMQRRCDEETLVVKWNALGRKKMPEFDLEEEMAKLDKAPSQPRCEQCARLRKTGWFWYWEAKKAQRALSAQQPAAVDGARPVEVTDSMVKAACGAYVRDPRNDAEHAKPGTFHDPSEHLQWYCRRMSRDRFEQFMRAVLTAALAAQPGGSDNDR